MSAILKASINRGDAVETAPTKNNQKATLTETLSPMSRDAALLAVQRALDGIKFGTVQIVIQDGRIVQIEKTKKIRLT